MAQSHFPEVFQALKAKLKKAGFGTNVGDEGGFAPDLASSDQALDFISAAVSDAGGHRRRLSAT